MKFTIQTKVLKAACTKLKSTLASKSTKKIFECAKLELGNGIDTLTISTTDLQYALELRLPVTDTEGSVGVAIVPLAQLAKLAKQKAETISFELAGNETRQLFKAEWSGKKTSNRRDIEAELAAQYPELVSTKGDDYTDVPELGETLIEANVFTGKEAARFVLNGIQLKNGHVAALDGRRIYTRKLTELGIAGGVIISLPKLGAPNLRKLNYIRTAKDGRMVQLQDRTGDMTLSIRVMEGTFPDWQQIIPQDGKSCPIDAEAWTEAIEAVEDCTGVQSQAVIVEIKPDSVTFTAKGSDAGGESTVAQDTGELSPSRAGFNPAFLLDFLKLEPTTVMLTGKNSAAKFTADGGRELVVMPVLID